MRTAILLVVCVVAPPFVVPALVYFFMWTVLVSRGTTVAYAAAILGAVVAIASFVVMLAMGLRVNGRRILNLPAKLSLWCLPGFYLPLVTIIVPASSAIAIWSEMQTPEASYSGHRIHILSPHDQLKVALRKLEKRGIWTWMRGLDQ